MAEPQNSLPPGWECKLDAFSGKYYFINHYTKTTTWDDPRTRYIPHHGTPKHPSNVVYEHIPLQELRSTSRMSPLTVRGAKVQDSSLTVQSETDDAVAKIGAMFPTVSDSHIRLLMKNCRYMKSIFPKAEETVILEVLYSNDSNIQKASEVLKEMGFQRKEPVKLVQQKIETKTEEQKIEEVKNEAQSRQTPKVKSSEEKAAIKEKLKEKYNDVAEHVITIALESVDFDETRANQILEIMVQEDTERAKDTPIIVTETSEQENTTEVEASTSTLPISQSRQSIKSLLKSDKIDKENTFTRLIEGLGFKSATPKNRHGPNPDFIRGPNDKNLLVNYIDWQGPNEGFRKGARSLANGPNRSLLNTKSHQAQGPNTELRKGPKFGLAKGSIFSQLKNGGGESRGK